MPKLRRLIVKPLCIAGVFLLFTLVACDGVVGCMPGCQSESEVEELAEYFPEDTETMFVAPNVASIFEAIDGAHEYEELPVPVRRKAEAQFDELGDSVEEFLGFSPTNPDGWTARGVNLDAAVVAGLLDGHSVVCIPVNERSQFETYAIETLGPGLVIDESARHREEKIGDHFIHTFDDELAWGYLDDFACGALPASSDADGQPGPLISRFLDGLNENDSLANDPTFEQFHSEVLADSQLGLFEREPIADDPNDSQTDGWRLDATGTGIEIHNDVFSAYYWLPMLVIDGEPIDYDPIDSRTINWSYFAKKDTGFGLRFAVHPEYLWNDFRSSADDAVLRETDEVLSRILEVTDYRIDLEEDFIENLSGEFGLFIYDVGEIPDTNGDPIPNFGNDLRALALLQFINADYLSDFLDRLLAVANEELPFTLERRTIQAARDGTYAIEAIALEPLPVTFYRIHDLLVLATDAVSESEMVDYLTGSRDIAALSDHNSKLGGPLAESDHFNGMYLSEDGAQFLRHNLELQEFVPDDLQEILVTILEYETATYVDAHFYPSAAAVPDLLTYFFEGLLDQFATRHLTTNDQETEPTMFPRENRNDTRPW